MCGNVAAKRGGRLFAAWLLGGPFRLMPQLILFRIGFPLRFGCAPSYLYDRFRPMSDVAAHRAIRSATRDTSLIIFRSFSGHLPGGPPKFVWLLYCVYPWAHSLLVSKSPHFLTR